jgi:hypothetical protein
MIPVDAIEIPKPAADNVQGIGRTTTNEGRTAKGYLSGRRPHWMSTVSDRKKSAPTQQDDPP